ncbi:kazrin-like isoform X2 [Amphiura filiformis]|uniref:kazrin-like isoform X2 n=1 Tax=Amphiura filiformis TaxID=82378 RepID=UPI003B21E6BF
MADVFKAGGLEPGHKDSITSALQSLDSLNDQIVQVMLTPKSIECQVSHQARERDGLKSSLGLMRRLLLDAQTKYRRVVEENKKLITKINDQTIQPPPVTETHITDLGSDAESMPDSEHDSTREWHNERDESELARLRQQNDRLESDNKNLLQQLDDLRALGHCEVEIPSASELKIQLTQTEHELARAKEALSAMKQDRKRLKGEKVDLLNQMKQLYCTLESKEEEMRDFLRNYEQRMSESDENLKKIIAEKEEVEKDRWEILKRAREAAERSVALRETLDKKEKEVESLEQELDRVKEQLALERRKMSNSTPRITVTSTTVNGTPDGSIKELHLSSDSNISQGLRGEPVGSAGDTPVREIPMTPVSARSSRSTQSYASDVTSADSGSREYLIHPSEPLSRSTEELAIIENMPPKEKKKMKKKKFNSLSKIFGKKNRPTLEQIVFDGFFIDPKIANLQSSDTNISTSSSGSRHNLHTELALDDQEKARLAEKCKTTPMSQWKASMIVSWIEVNMCLPQYSERCAENIKSGRVLLGLSDQELEQGMGIDNVLHRRKLRMAIEEQRNPADVLYPKTSELDHRWVSRTWINDIGLGQYSQQFDGEKIDGRVLNSLNRKDLEKHLNITRKFHQVSILHGIDLLRRVKFDKAMLAERRAQSQDIDCDPLVWTTQRLLKWARSIDLKEYADNLLDSGVHGALLVLEPSFDSDAMANALGIPTSKTIIRRHLTTELNGLIQPARSTLEALSIDGRLRRSSANSLNRNFQRNYTSPNTERERGGKPTFRGSLGRALGRKLRNEMNYASTFSSVPEQVRAKSRSQELESTIV